MGDSDNQSFINATSRCLASSSFAFTYSSTHDKIKSFTLGLAAAAAAEASNSHLLRETAQIKWRQKWRERWFEQLRDVLLFIALWHIS